MPRETVENFFFSEDPLMLFWNSVIKPDAVNAKNLSNWHCLQSFLQMFALQFTIMLLAAQPIDLGAAGNNLQKPLQYILYSDQ
jgi:hypothetical protein